MSAMHEYMQERTGEQQKEKARPQYVGTMLREQQESGDRQQDQKGDARLRRQEAAFWPRLPVCVVMVRHEILLPAIYRIAGPITQSK
ncbi:MAG: hypothetical protein ABIL01_05415 [Pseudomonadota bacterium]